MMNHKLFNVDPENFALVRDYIGSDRVCELEKADAGLLLPHVERHPQTIYVAASGVDLGEVYGAFAKCGSQVAIEWVRFEDKRKPNEPECNLHRYLIGPTADGNCCGSEVTGTATGQVGDHWTDIDEVASRHFGGRS